MLTPEDVKKYSDFFNKTISGKSDSIKDIDDLTLVNLDHLRSFSSTLLSTNITVIGAVIAVFITSSDKIINTPLVVTGIILLLVNSVLLTFYSALVLVGENEKLSRRRKYLHRTYDEILNLTHEHTDKETTFMDFDEKIYFPKLKQFANEEEIQVKKDEESSWSAKYLYVFSTLFVIGIVLIILGIYSWMNTVLNPLWAYLLGLIAV